METDTAQPPVAAENVSLSIEEAADAFKVHLGQAEAPERPRDERGRFASEQAEEEIEAPEDEERSEDADIGEEQDGEAEAPEEGQPEPTELPSSWSKEDAELWASLPPEAQAKIAEREGQREAAVNHKFQEAANDRKAAQAIASEAQASREQAVALIDQVATLMMPERPPTSMLDRNSGDYDPDTYHLLNAQFDQSMDLIRQLGQQRQNLVAQQQAEATRAEQQAMVEIERVTRPILFKDVPELEDAAKAPAILRELTEYAIANHIPADTFAPENAWKVTSAELRILWKAQQYDKQQEARAKVKTQPKPQPKPAPAVRPGVATPKSAIEATRLKGSMDRLARTGSVEDGAAIFKHFMKKGF